MERGVFTDTLLTAILDRYVAVDFNPEIQDPLFWNGVLYQRKSEDRFPFHPLSLELTRKNFILPSVIILDEKDAIIDAIPFYLPPVLMKDILTYYGNDIHKQKSWADFRKELGR
jgi:thioredoxin-related protein